MLTLRQKALRIDDAKIQPRNNLDSADSSRTSSGTTKSSSSNASINPDPLEFSKLYISSVPTRVTSNS
jgi:hypothetical protein